MKERFVIQEDDLEIEPDAIIDTQTNTMYECSSIDMPHLCKLLNDYERKIKDLEKYCKGAAEYAGIAYDEPERLKKNEKENGSRYGRKRKQN